jgi:hypothetical protein
MARKGTRCNNEYEATGKAAARDRSAIHRAQRPSSLLFDCQSVLC